MIVHVYVRYCVYVFMRVYVCVYVYYAYICVCVCVCVYRGSTSYGTEGDVPPLLAVVGGTRVYIDLGGTRGYMKISMCYELSLRVDNDLR